MLCSGGYLVVLMKAELEKRLKYWQDNAASAIQMIDQDPVEDEHKIKLLISELRSELSDEYDRIVSPKEQKSMGTFELSIYATCVEDAWTRSKLRRLRLESPISKDWVEAMEAVLYHLGKFSD